MVKELIELILKDFIENVSVTLTCKRCLKKLVLKENELCNECEKELNEKILKELARFLP